MKLKENALYQRKFSLTMLNR